jgi:branched-chain amino acid transport system substrate-binding protein
MPGIDVRESGNAQGGQMQGRAGRIAAFGSLTAIVALAAAAAGYGRTDAGLAPAAASVSDKTLVSCRNATISIMAPITGPVAFLGVEQRNWARFGLDLANRANRKRYRLLEGDTQLDPARASTVGQRHASNRNVLAVVGPAGSQEVLAVSPIFRRAGLGYISGSATRVDLTSGAHRGFFRVVPHDGIQAPTDARYIRNTLRADRIVVVDDQTSYGQPLADAVAAQLRRLGASTVTRESARQQQTDYSALVSSIPRDTQIVFLAWQVAADAQLLARQLREQGRAARIFGSDGLFAPGDFNVNGSFVSSFAPDIRNRAANRQLVASYNRRFGTNWGTFGPPVYLAVQIAHRALRIACRDGNASRAEVRLAIARTRLASSVLGMPIRFTARGDVVGARFFIFEIRDGRYVTVG